MTERYGAGFVARVSSIRETDPGQPGIEYTLDMRNNAVGIFMSLNKMAMPNANTPGLAIIQNGTLVLNLCEMAMER